MTSRRAGQSLVELALVLPVLLFLLLIAIDFGRVYLGYINLQQMTRVAANFAAEHASAWGTPTDTAVLTRYQQQVENDAASINCDLQRDSGGNLPSPAFVDRNFDLGSRVEVRIECRFQLITPFIAAMAGDAEGRLLLEASIVYPIREGAVAEVPGGGAPILIAPIADFLGTPQSGYQPLDVVFTDTSRNGPTEWSWDFGNGGDSTEGPHTRRYECGPTVPAGESCQFDVSLEVGSPGGFDSVSRSGYITVWVPPETGPIAEFEGSPLRGTAPLSVTFSFVDVRADAGDPVVYTSFEWDLDGDGSFERAGPALTTVTNNYANPGTYNITLRVTGDGEPPQQLTKKAYVIVDRRLCTVPDFAGVKVSNAQARWAAAGFTTTVSALPKLPKGPADYKISYQSIVGGTVDPAPLGCDSLITVGP